ncbi:MAG: hypothetical protein KBT03_04115 [Bacteroidales bacterium]|nr:hypothetical protein [Candidatus Scybalousia scybalohippi]
MLLTVGKGEKLAEIDILSQFNMELLRVKLGYTKDEFCDKILIMSVNTYNRRLKNPGDWKIKELNDIANKLEITFKELISMAGVN